MSQDTNISQLVINKLTKQQYDSIVTPNESELYLITDDVGITDTDIIAALGYTPQEELVSGTNIKTINNTSLLGSGNIDIQGGGTITVDQTYDPTSANAQSGVAIAGANFLTASSLNNYVTTNTDQNITGTKTFVGQKKIGFKQSASNNKLGFTLYDNNNVEKGYLEFNPTNTIDGAPLMTLGNYAQAAAGITHVGFRKYDSSNSGAYNLLAPLVSKAKSPFNLTTTYTNFYLPLGFTDGTTTVKAANTGMVDLSPILPTNVLPSQTGQSGKFLTTDGTNPSWATVSVTVDQTYDPTSTNAQSGVALSEVFNEKQDTLIAGDHITINEATPHWSQAEEVSNLHIDNFDWVSIAYGDNKFVVLGDEGYTSTSIDGTEWTSAVKNPNLFQPCVGYTVIYGDGKFVALSHGGHLSSSVDGVTWAASETVSVLENGGWKSIAYGNGKFVALGYMGYISTSNDGSTWAQPEQYAPDEYGDSAGYNVIAYGSNKFVVMDARGYVATSTNGTDWTDLGAISNLGNHGWEALTYDGEKFIAIGGDGYFSSSEDGVTWELSTLIPQLDVNTRWVSVACSESKIVTLGNSSYIGVYSSDVSGPMISAHFDVDQTFDGTSTNAQSGVAIVGAKFLQNTANGSGSVTILGTPANGANAVNIGNRAYTAGYAVSIGNSASSNGDYSISIGSGANAYGASSVAIGRSAKTNSTSAENALALGRQAEANAKGAIQLGKGANATANSMAIGFADIDGNGTAASYSMLDGTTGLIPDARISSNIARKADSLVAGNNIIIEEKPSWTKATQVNNLTSERFQNSLAYGNGKFVSISRYGYISTSTDGITWTEDTQISNLNNHNWRAITYGNNKFVAIDFYGYISTSTDGTTWTEATQSTSLGNNTWWHSIAYGNNKFVAVAMGQGGHVSTSTDGITWTEAVQNANLDSCNSLAYGNGEFRAIVLGNNISTSTDGITWTDPSENAKLGINSTWTITSDGTKFVAIEQVYGAISTYNNYEWTPPVFSGNLYQKASWLEGFTFGDNKLVAIGLGNGNYNYVSVCDYSKNSNVISNIFGVDQEFNSSSENAVSGQAIANTFVPRDAGNYHIANSTDGITLTYADNDSNPTKQYGLGVSEQMGAMAGAMDMTDQTSPKMFMAGLTGDGIMLQNAVTSNTAILGVSSNNNLLVNGSELATQTWVTNQGYITSASLPTMTYTSTTETLTFS